MPEKINAKPVSSEYIPWYKVMALSYFSPLEATYRRLLADPGARFIRSAMWVLISTILAAVIPYCVLWLGGGNLISDINYTNDYGYWNVILDIIGTLASYYFSVQVFSWLANRLGGTGNVGDVGYLLGAIWAPNIILECGLEFIADIYASLALSILVLLYFGFLMIVAVRTVHRLNWGKAASTVIIPTMLLFVLLFGCLYISGL